MTRMEQESTEFEAMVLELLANNKAKKAEMMQYEKRLQQISNNTAQTVCKVDKLNVTMKNSSK